ncbi:sigma 54-interacting transcriptional regulator [Clostridiaceae bacterium 35-E11]
MISMGFLIVNSKNECTYANEKAAHFLSQYGKYLQTYAPANDILKSTLENNPFSITLNRQEFLLKSQRLDTTDDLIFYGIVIYDLNHIRTFVSDTTLEEFRAILDFTQDAIFIDDMHGNTQWINKACEKLYEIKKEEVIGKHIDVLENQGIFSPSVARLVFEKKQEVSILHSNKHGKKILTTGTPIVNEKGTIRKVISTSRDITELIHLKNQLEDIQNELVELKEQHQEHIDNVIIKSYKMKSVLQLAKRLAQIDSTVLITGESGVGKGVIAKYIHELGERSSKSFVKVNCGAIPESLLESELFGYEYGAFTGSKKQGKLGLFELAQQGTIFLDEIGELPLHLQVKILQVIQDKEIQRVGGISPIHVDVRIIAATNKDLRVMVDEKKFREDLFYRLNVVPIHIVPLRERQEDIFPLTRYFLQKYNEKFNEKKRIDPNAMAYLIKYTWPGNVRELENIIERLVITTKDDNILPHNLPNYILQDKKDDANIRIPVMMDLKSAIEEVEKQIIQNAVIKHKTTREVAKALGVSQPTIVRKMNRYQIKANDSCLNQYDS